MRRKFTLSIPQILFIVIISVLLTAVTVLAASGTTDAPAAPGSTASYTLEDIYQRLSNGTAGSQSAFTEPAVAPGTGSMHSLNDIYAVIPDTGSDVAGADGSRTFDIPDGVYRSNMATCNDTDLVASNIKHGVTLLGVKGTYTGPGWNLYGVTAERGSLFTVDMLSATDGWAVGNYGHIYHYDGSDWSLNATVAYTPFYFDMLSATDGWIAGRAGHIYHYDGAEWILHTTTEEGSDLYGINMLNASDGWIVGDDGYIYHFNGSSWNLDTTTPEGNSIWSIAMLNAMDGWAVGYPGSFYRYNGSRWNLDKTTTEVLNLYSISMLSATDGWVVGDDGYIYHLLD